MTEIKKDPDALERARITRPEPGDVWHEHFILYHVVLDVLPSGNVIVADHRLADNEGQTVDLNLAREITPEEHLHLVTYASNRNSFVASVVINSKAGVGTFLVKEWREKYFGNYLVIQDRPPVSIPLVKLWLNPVWPSGAATTRDWEYYINPAVRKLWLGFTETQREALYQNALELIESFTASKE